jgi:hypothetical protein
MIRIGTNPALASLPFIASVTAGVSVVLASPASALFAGLGAGGWSWALGFVAVWVVFAGGIVAGVSIAYGTVQWDPERRVARLRGREVSLDSITEAWRSLSTGANGAAYLHYRFVSTEGASVRLLVAGRPMKGLDADDLKDLRRFVAELPLQVPSAGKDELSDRQRAAAVNLTSGGGKSRVSRETLLEELAPGNGVQPVGGIRIPTAEPVNAAPAGVGGLRGAISLIEAARLDQQWQADDTEALAVLAEKGRASRRLRRVLGWLTVAAGGIAFASVVLAAVDEEVRGLLDSDSESWLKVVIVAGILGGIAFYLAWCAAADSDVRHRRGLAREWIETRDDRERERGLAEPFLLAWGEPVRRLPNAVGFIALVIGLFAILVGTFVPAEEGQAIGRVIALVLGLAGVIWFGLVVAASLRRRSADAEEKVVLGGLRVLPRVVRSR